MARVEPAPISTDALESETPVRQLAGVSRTVALLLAVALAIYSLYWVVAVVEPQIYRVTFLLIAIVLTFLRYPVRKAAGQTSSRPSLIDWAFIGATAIALLWPIVDLAQFPYRAAEPGTMDLVCGALAIVVTLEATRRTTGWILPFSAIGFLLYAFYGPWLDRIGLGIFAHRGYSLDRLVGSLYMTLEGIFGVPLDVAATYIVLFAVYGAVLQFSGAGSFFMDWSMAAMGRSASGAGPGRTVTLAGFLLGTVSGSGVATTVMLGSVAWPVLKRAGYPPEVGGAILSAGGIGAIISPPTLGAAAFLIAENLGISYLQVLGMAIVPTLLYYLSIFLMIEADSRRLNTRPAKTATATLRELTWRGGYHFTSLIAIAVFMAMGMSTFRAVFWAAIVAFALSFLNRETALWPRRVVRTLETAGNDVLPVVATTATAGIIVGVVTLTGLGLNIAGIIVTIAGSSLFLTVLYSAIAVWMLGLAVPVTASYIIAAVMIAPALIQVGVAPAAAHMFIFYYAVLSEVSPPTALSPFAAAAITGANPFRTMMLTWKYTLPAFIVPFVFTLDRSGMGILLKGSVTDIAIAAVTAAAGVAALAIGTAGWLRRRVNLPERVLAIAAGLLLMYPSAQADIAGVAALASAVIAHMWRTRLGNSGTDP